MTDTSHRSSSDVDQPYGPAPTAWAGWVVFAGVMLIMLGAFQIIEGLVALFDDGFYLVGREGLVVNVDYNTWGWVHVVVGVVGVLAGLGLLAGNMVARVVGVIVAFLSALVNLAFLAAYPVWSVIMITIDVVVIYAIVVHGKELKGYYR
ncbi:DUF7144 family membrane protein [Geodermatophilus sp. SYSU D00815]